MREFRDKLATYLLESESPVVITRHGDTVGYFIPARRKRSETDKEALREAATRWQEILDAEGISRTKQSLVSKNGGVSRSDDRAEAGCARCEHPPCRLRGSRA
ncbi:hypothetical protein [Terriglobus sp. RCC_193]|uniref:hypothetical protein n=1 Tax=Terriglobus sp. RCC_193 TaxID=3239218 RepID=UPI003524EB3E